MGLFTPAEVAANYAKVGKAKSEQPIIRMFVLAIAAGLFIAFGAAAASTAAHNAADAATIRLISGLLFPFGLGMVMLVGAELFTGNCLIAMSVLNKDTALRHMLKNWGVVYAGNFVGAVMLAAACAYFGQLDYSSGGLAVLTVKIAAAKCGIPFAQGVVTGILCNVLVCVGVLCSLSAQDTFGRISGAYIPVALFVICGFEHSIANMYYIPAGLFSMQIPAYADKVLAAGIDVSALTWGNFFLRNLLPVTIGNIIGGVLPAVMMWYCHLNKRKSI